MKATRTVANIVAVISALSGSLLLVKNRLPWGLYLWPLRLIAGALSPIMAVVGAKAALLGMAARSPLAVLAGSAGAYLYGQYFWRAVAFPDRFAEVFGKDWWEKIPEPRRQHMLQGHWTWNAAPPRAGRVERDVPYATVPDANRSLLCDLWFPPLCAERSGLALVFIHGGAWYLGDKGQGTDPLFRRLAAQGHVVMDVAYRMFPETDMYGMVGDVKRAIAWLREHAAEYEIDPQRIVIGGGSAGGHLALLAGFTGDVPELTPEDLQGKDLSVRGVISIYGVTDMRANYYHTNQHVSTRDLPREYQYTPGQVRNRVLARFVDREQAIRRGMDKPRHTASFLYLLGGHPEEKPEEYDRFSPLAHAKPGLPPTLLIHGEQDVLVPAEATRELESKLREAGVPVVSLYIPQTDHAFDLVLPRISPPAQAEFYMVERFLAGLV